ncbi:patatin-like phospholipase family protein [Silanimonas sp.]|jgi:NTE family protein|uniref:patatin-like phospholipase family protein n=1 Tax=Silanimonas sp. TaxID=1929290 RepID=UPI00261243B5|nr:patatin-like phospholipase family protein [Silanimonas sp.]
MTAEGALPATRGKRVALVLGAGGARGLAHIGVIEALEARGFEIAAIAGSSMGALVGGIHAAGKLAAYRDWADRLERNDVLRLLDVTFGASGLIRGDRVIATLRDLVGEHRIEGLPIPYVAVATDLATQREVWFQQGPLFDAIRASIAIPMVFTPHEVNGRELVDGGLLAPLPLAATRGFHCDYVVAVDLNARSPRAPTSEPVPLREAEMFNDDAPAAPSGWKTRVASWFNAPPPPVGATPAAPAGGIASLLDLMSRSMDTMHSQMTRLQVAQDPPDLVIRVPRDAASFYEFWRAKELRERGRELAEDALSAWVQ